MTPYPTIQKPYVANWTIRALHYLLWGFVACAVVAVFWVLIFNAMGKEVEFRDTVRADRCMSENLASELQQYCKNLGV